MTGARKVVLLSLALLLPVLIFLFLKFFGQNQFDVPPLYEEGVPEPVAGCDVAFGRPYIIQDSIIRKITPERPDLLVIDFSDAPAEIDEPGTPWTESEVRFVDRSALRKTFHDIEFLKKCILLTPSPQTIVLLDRLGRIRGHYIGTDRDDVDRLKAEIKIILKKY